MALTVERDGQQRTVDVTLGSVKDEAATTSTTPSSGTSRGVRPVRPEPVRPVGRAPGMQESHVHATWLHERASCKFGRRRHALRWASGAALRQGVRQSSDVRCEPAMGPICSIPPSTGHDAPVT